MTWLACSLTYVLVTTLTLIALAASSEPCPDNCKSCYNATTCNDCKESFALSSGTCIPCEVPNCINCNSSEVCERCDGGYFLVSSKTCRSCRANCLQCINAWNCTYCNIGYFKNAIGVCEVCPDHGKECSNQSNCGVCTEGYYRDGQGQCKQCPDNCFNCTNAHACKTCNNGYYLESGQCVACGAGCSNCEERGACVECSEGGGECYETCPAECKDGPCNHLTGVCLSCRDGTESAHCPASCPGYCYNGTCDRNGICYGGCQAGYYGDHCKQPCEDNHCVNWECFPYNGTCIPQCPSGCESCYSTEYCLVCKTGYYGEVCQYDCSMCFGGSCYQDMCRHGCKDGYYEEGVACKPCRDNCTKCTSADTCSSCIRGTHGDRCQFECDVTKCAACKSNSTECTACVSNRFDPKYENGSCLCDRDECVEKSINGKCDKCKQPGWYWLDEGCCPCPRNCKYPGMCNAVGSCKGGCSSGYWGTFCEKICTVQNCLTCENAFCDLCQDGYHGIECKDNCSDGCFKVTGNRTCSMETGQCLLGCVLGRWGSYCGHACNDSCVDKQCDSSSGHCKRCNSTHTGPFCGTELGQDEENEGEQQQRPKSLLPLILGIVATVVVVAVVVTIAIVLIRKRSTKRQEEESQYDGIVNRGDNTVGVPGIGSNPDDDGDLMTENAMYVPFEVQGQVPIDGDYALPIKERREANKTGDVATIELGIR